MLDLSIYWFCFDCRTEKEIDDFVIENSVANLDPILLKPSDPYPHFGEILKRKTSIITSEKYWHPKYKIGERLL